MVTNLIIGGFNIIQGGAIANKAGSDFEDIVSDLLENMGYSKVDKYKFLTRTKTDTISDQPMKIFTRQLDVGNGLFNMPSKCDFAVYNSEKPRRILIIECKWQHSGGSVWEKLMHLVCKIKRHYPYDTIIILDGKGYPSEVDKGLREEVGGKFIGVYNEVELAADKDNLL